MLQSDWLSYETLSVIGMQWPKLLYEMGNFGFLNFSEVLVESLETVAKFPSGLNEEHLPLLNFTGSNTTATAY